MNDIVERLRLASKYSSILRQSEQIVSEAADEIERLRGLLREAPKHTMPESLERRVREALGE